METRSEQRRRELSERRQRATKLISRKWEEGATSPRGESEQDQSGSLSPPTSPPPGGSGGRTSALAASAADVSDDERQREERLARREERRRQREEEEREHLNRLEERRRRREELKAQIGTSPSGSRRSISVSDPVTTSSSSSSSSSTSSSSSSSSPPSKPTSSSFSSLPIADSLCTSPPKTSPRSSTPPASSTDGADPAPVVSPRRSQSVRQSSDGGGQRTSPRNSPRRTAAGSMIALGSGSADRATTSPGESPRSEGETKEERAKMRGALLELEELQKANEKDLMKRESFLDLQSLVTHMSGPASSPVASLLNSAAGSSTPLASITSLATLQSNAATTTNGGGGSNNAQPRKEVLSPRESARAAKQAKKDISKHSKELEAAAAAAAGGKKKGSTLLGKLKLPSPTMNRKKIRPETTVDPIPAFASPTTPQKAKEDKKKAQLRNYTIAGGRGVQHELPLGVSWKDLKAILASSNAPTTERMVKSLPLPRDTRLTREELFGSRSVPNLQVLRKHLFEEGRLEIDLAKEILAKGKALFAACPNVLQLTGPLAICGDVHGQYYDMLTLMDTAGQPKDTPYLFLGDYVDRGCFSTEVCFYLTACKINYPQTFHLLRGNHECRQLAEFFNFKAECKSKYEESIYTEFMEMFDALPLAAVVDTQQGKYLAVHGGLSPFIKNVDEIKKLDRFSEPPDQGAFCDLLWSDPLVDQYDLNAREHQTVTYLSNRNRGCGYLYGYKAVTEFLEANQLLSVIRAHEVQQYGYAEHWFKQDSLRPADDEKTENPTQRVPPVITVFSAPNYCDLYQNKGAFMWLQADGKYEFKQISWTTHPAYLPQFMNGITFSFPFIAEQLSKFCLTILKSVEEDEQMAADFASEEEHAERIRKKVETVRKLMIIMKKLREENVSQLPAQEAVEDLKQRRMDRNLSVFERALRIDKKNEARPKVDRLYRTL